MPARKKTPAKKPSVIDTYLAKLADPERAALQKLRETILSVAPESEEVLSYGMPTFRHHTMLVGFRAAAKHLTFFVWSSSVLKPFAKELTDFTISAGGIRFTPDQPIPTTLVKKIVKVRKAENETRAVLKKAKPARKH